MPRWRNWLWERLIIPGQVVGSGDKWANFQCSRGISYGRLWHCFPLKVDFFHVHLGLRKVSHLFFFLSNLQVSYYFQTDPNSTFLISFDPFGLLGTWSRSFKFHISRFFQPSTAEVLVNEGQKSRQPGAVSQQWPHWSHRVASSEAAFW